MKISQCFDALTAPEKSLSWSSAIAALLLVTLSVAGPLSRAQEQSDPRWVTTWTASPSTLPGQADPQDPAQDQTLRLISHSSVGGDSVRIRLSNTHGNGPITVGAASIAMQSTGSSIRAGSSSTLSFSGQASVTIPRGAVVISDAINYPVPQMSNLSVSLYLPANSGFLTAHALSNQVNYLSEDAIRLSRQA